MSEWCACASRAAPDSRRNKRREGSWGTPGQNRVDARGRCYGGVMSSFPSSPAARSGPSVTRSAWGALAVTGAALTLAALSASPALAAKTITVTTPKSAPFAFNGMPTTLKAGTYTFRYVNNSGIGHNLRFLRSSASPAKGTPLFSSGSRSVTVTLKKGTARYECTPHKTMMKGSIRVT